MEILFNFVFTLREIKSGIFSFFYIESKSSCSKVFGSSRKIYELIICFRFSNYFILKLKNPSAALKIIETETPQKNDTKNLFKSLEKIYSREERSLDKIEISLNLVGVFPQ